MSIILTENLSFKYGQQLVVNGLNLAVAQGEVFGFVGPNGAGKSTTIKLLLGLLTPNSGSVKLFDRYLSDNRIDILKRVGTLVEMPSLYPHLTAEENLEIVRKVHRLPASQCDNILRITGILDAKRKKVKEFSLGMKQRLGIAMALFHSPELLILDEPINGLDPEGIQEFRFFLKRIVSEQGATIFISSHILSELEQLATTVGIIARGKMKYQGLLSTLKAQHAGRLVLKVANAEQVIKIIQSKWSDAMPGEGNSIQFPGRIQADVPKILAYLVQSGMEVYGMMFEQPNLESIFIQLVNSKDDE
jgi:ABC-2 type transport system ATP-binding protein